MEAINRDQEEQELAAAVLALWLVFDSVKDGRLRQRFDSQFDSKVRPILSRIYGSARSTLAGDFGVNYPTREEGGRQIVQVPGLNAKINQYKEELWGTFTTNKNKFDRNKVENERRKEAEDRGETDVPKDRLKTEIDESQAETIAVTTVSQTQSDGELDASHEVESREGSRLVGIWRTEPGACPICRPLEGTTDEWKIQFPGGPPAHPNCRCHLEWKRMI